MKNTLHTLFTYFDTAQKIITELENDMDETVLACYSLAWQANKQTIKAKNTHRKNYYLLIEKKI